MSWKINENSSTIDEIREKRRANLSQRIRKARLQLDSLTNLQSSYATTRENLVHWRSKMLEQIHQAHQTSLDELNDTFQQFHRMRSTFDRLHPEENLWKNAEFSFDFHRVNQLEGQLELLKLSDCPSEPSTNPAAAIPCRLLIHREQFQVNWNFYENFLHRIDGPTSESILVCPLEILEEIIRSENEIRILIDQSHLTVIRPQISRMSKDFDLVQLQPAQESCPQSTERVIKIIGHDPKKILACLQEIFSISLQQGSPFFRSMDFPFICSPFRKTVHLGSLPSDELQPVESSSVRRLCRSLHNEFDRFDETLSSVESAM